jgi:cyclohexyl-isocyanide hydratase
MPHTLKKDQKDTVKIAFVPYADVTLLDFVGPYEPLTRLKTMGFVPDLEYHTCDRKEWIQSSEGTVLKADTVSPDLSGYDYVVIPGGNGVMERVRDKGFLSWLAVRPGRTPVATVCGGVLLIGAAGLLRDRIVEDDHVITAGGVTSAIDIGLYLCEKIAGRDVREKIQVPMDSPYYPPTDGPAPGG